MAVLCTTLISGMDAASYDQAVQHIAPVLRAAPGFVSHAAYPGQTAWTVTEIWDSEPQFRTFFDATVAPNLPPGTEPTVLELHNVLTADRA